MEKIASTAETVPATFSLATVLFVMAVICVLLAEYQAMGIDVIPVWWLTLLLVAAYVLNRRRLWGARNLALGVLIVSGCGAMFPQMCGPRWVWQYTECVNRLKMVALAAHDYESRNTSLPPQNQLDRTGLPGLSWRVLVLPFLEQNAVFQKFDLQGNWQSATNRPLANLELRDFRCPSEMNTRNSDTSYVAISGDDTCWPTAGPITLNEIRDGSSHAILFVETHDSGILWPEPRDLEYDKLDWRIHGTPGNSISSSHGPVIQYFDGSRKLKQRASVHVAMADGSTLRLNPNVDPEVLKQLANRRDGLPKELP